MRATVRPTLPEETVPGEEPGAVAREQTERWRADGATGRETGQPTLPQKTVPGEEREGVARERTEQCWISYRYLPFCWRCRLAWGTPRKCTLVLPVAKDEAEPSQPKRKSQSQRGLRIVCAQRRACSAAAVCCWFWILLFSAIVLFVVVAYWTCMTLPVHRLHYGDASVSDVAASTPTDEPAVARVLSLNMFLRTDGITDDATATVNDFKRERLEYFIANVINNYDILLLQETWSVNDAGRKKRLVSAARDAGFEYFARSRCAVGGLMDAMLLILSRHPLVSTHEHTFTKAVGVDAYATKGVLHARAWLNGNENCAVDLFATHLQAGGGEAGDTVRSLQTRQVAQFVEAQRGIKIKAGERVPPVVVGGDFNINGRTSDGNGTASAQYAKMMQDLSLKEGELKVVFPLDASRVLPVTSPKRTKDGGSKLVDQDSTQGTCLDYVFYGLGRGESGERGDGGVRAIPGSGRVNALFASDSPFVTVSDHFGVELNLTCER